MIRFKDNPNLSLTVVKTVRGVTEYRRNCRKIKDKYYIPNEDCFFIGGKWHAYNSKLITLDHEIGKYVLADSPGLLYGIVDFKDDDSPIFGYFSENKYNNVFISVKEYGLVLIYNEKILKDNKFVEDITNGTWYYKKNLTPNEISNLSKIRGHRVAIDKGYNIEDNKDEFAQKIQLFNDYPVTIPIKAMKYGRMLGKTTYGLEIESAQGGLPDKIQNRTGVVVCRDGSIENAEFVTIPMSGAKGLVNIKYLSSELIKRTTTDIKCSFHIHLGTLPTDRLFIVALYALGIRIQDEIFTMFPYYKTEWDGIKKQNYNQKLRKLGTGLLKGNASKEEFTKYIDEAYYRIFTWLNNGVPPDDNFNRNNNHHHEQQKWNRKQR